MQVEIIRKPLCRIRQSLGKLSVLFAIVLVVLTRASDVGAAVKTSLVVSPSSSSIIIGQTAQVDILINDYDDANPPGPGANGVYGAEIRLTFDQNIVNVRDDDAGSPGTQMTLGHLLTSQAPNYYVLFNEANNSAGTIRLVVTQLNPAVGATCPTPPAACSDVILTIHFVGVATGASTIHFTYQKLANANGAQIPASPAEATTTDGVINASAPTAIGISDFSATRTGMHKAGVKWKTDTETDVAGFNVWRSSNRDTGYAQRNENFLPAKNPGAVQGADYLFADKKLPANIKQYYKLEAVTQSNTSEWFGPVVVPISATCARKPKPVKLLSPLDNGSSTPHATLDWSRAPCSDKYRVQVRRSATDGAVVLNQKIERSKLTLQLVDGRTYYWRVRAIVGKRHSFWSEWHSFTVKQ